MTTPFLLTSFATWKPEQPSNSSDDLLHHLQQDGVPAEWQFLRHIPVAFDLAPARVIAVVETLQPAIVVCCGMAEKRHTLQLEYQAVQEVACETGVWQRTLQTAIDLDFLVAATQITEVSRDAGTFVCNYLYFSLLEYLKTAPHTTHGLFVHVPVLTSENRLPILRDFRHILSVLSAEC